MPARDLILAASGASLPSDPDFEYVTLLLDGNGTNGGQNNTFIDSSTNNFTITRNGNTTQGSFSPYGTLWSNVFTTTTSRVTYGSESNWAFLSNGASDWTIDGWIFYSAADGDIVNTSGGSAQVGMQLYFGSPSSGLLTVYFTNGAPGAAGGSSSSGMTANQWNYFAVTFTSSTKVVAYYINGVAAGTNSHSGFSFSGSNPNFAARIGNSLFGSQGGGTNTMLSNLRISNTVRTGLTTVPISPFSSDGNTSLLVCSSNSFADKSSNNYSVSVNSTPAVQRFSPFEPSAPYSTSVIGGSVYVDGATNEALTAPQNNAFLLGTGDFTIEGWVYNTTTSQEFGVGDWRSIAGDQVVPVIAYRNGDVIWYINGSIAIQATWTQINCWTHIAVSRVSGSTRLFINGVQGGSTYSDSNNYLNPGTVKIAGFINGASKGYLSDFRVIKGTGLYSTTFTPPTAPLTAITNTSLLLNATNASIADLAMQNNLETVGNAQVSTSVKKFGTGSISFDGTGDSLDIVQTTPFLSAWTGDFTIECWAYTNNLSAQHVVWANKGTNSSGYNTAYINTNGSIGMGKAGVNEIVSASSTWTSGQWNHLAFVRNGSNLTIYYNGTSVATTASASTYLTTTATGFSIGKNFQTSTAYFNGYIDDFRVTYGLARYTANFTAPTAPFPIY